MSHTFVHTNSWNCFKIRVILFPCLILSINLNLRTNLGKISLLRNVSSSSCWKFTLPPIGWLIMCFVMNDRIFFFKIAFGWPLLLLVCDLFQLRSWDRSSEIFRVIFLPLVPINIIYGLENIGRDRLMDFFNFFVFPIYSFPSLLDFFKKRFNHLLFLWNLEPSQRAFPRSQRAFPFFQISAGFSRSDGWKRRFALYHFLRFNDPIRVFLSKIS